MKIKFPVFFFLLGCGVIFSCDPDNDHLECLPDSVNDLEDVIYNGHITLCNAQGSGLVYEPGLCSLYVRSDLIIFTVFSTNPSFPYYYNDTLSYNCKLNEGSRVFYLFDPANNAEMGSVHETENDIHLFIIDSQCPTSSFFEGDL